MLRIGTGSGEDVRHPFPLGGKKGGNHIKGSEFILSIYIAAGEMLWLKIVKTFLGAGKLVNNSTSAGLDSLI
jgi:hypothetical protein